MPAGRAVQLRDYHLGDYYEYPAFGIRVHHCANSRLAGGRNKLSTQLCSGALEPQAKGTDVFGLWADQSPISKLLKAMSRPSEHTANGKCRGE